MRAAGARSGVVVAGPGDGEEISFRLADEWLGTKMPKRVSPEVAEGELVRRFLRLYAPTTVDRFAYWSGFSPAAARAIWQAMEPEMAAVSLAGGERWVLREDLPILARAAVAKGVRLLPAFDPYLMAERDVICPDKKWHREVWKVIGWPGALVVNGLVEGIWKTKKEGKQVALLVRPFRKLAPDVLRGIASESRGIALFRSVPSVDLRIVSSL